MNKNLNDFNIIKYGFTEHFEQEFSKYSDEMYPARVITKHKNGNYTIMTQKGIFRGILAGKMYYKASERKDLPVVGDWVTIKYIDHDRAIIHNVLNRKSYFARKMPISGGRKIKDGIIQGGVTQEHVVAANIDIAFIIVGCDNNFDLRRIERYITLVYNSKVQPVIILNKADVCDDVETYISNVENIAIGLSVYAVSALNDINMDAFEKYLIEGNTVIFLGSSGVGKSTIINSILGENRQRTKEISLSNGKGRHTTTSSELIIHESGCMIIDTPGVRELQLWADTDVVNETFKDIIDIAQYCKYNDCKHMHEPGCAVKQAVKDGVISAERLQSYNKQYGEVKRLDERKKQYIAYQRRKQKEC